MLRAAWARLNFCFVVSVRWGLILLQEPPVWMNRERIEMGRIHFCKLFVSMLGGWGRIRWRQSCSRCSKRAWKRCKARRRSKADMWWLYSEIQSCFKQKIVLLQRFTNIAQLRIYRSLGRLQEFTRIPFFAAKITCYVQLEQDWISVL